MSEDHTKISGKPPNNLEGRMTAVAEAAKLLRAIAEPVPAGDTVKSAINRAASRVARFIAPGFAARWHAGRAEDIWRGEARGVWAEEMDAIRQAADARAMEGARHELKAVEARLARIEALLVSDPDFYGPLVAPFREPVGRSDRAVDRGE